LQYKDNNSALTWHKIRYTYSAWIRENAWETLPFSPDSKPHPYIDYMSSQCTVIVYIKYMLKSGTKIYLFVLVEMYNFERFWNKINPSFFVVIMSGSLSGDTQPPQAIYKGKTDQCHVKYNFPSKWHIYLTIWISGLTLKPHSSMQYVLFLRIL
jgi:hypothetical protein